MLLSIVAAPVCLATNACHLLPDNSHSSEGELTSYCGFGLHFPSISGVQHVFIYLLAVGVSSLEKCLLRSSAHF